MANRVTETLYFSFAVAFMFSTLGFREALLFAAAQWVVVAAGCYAGLVVMAKSEWWSQRMLQMASVCTGLGFASAYFIPGDAGTVWALFASAAAAGAAYAARQWHELTRTQGALRESYLALDQAVGTCIRVVGLAGCAALLTGLHNQFKPFMLVTGLAAALIAFLAGPLRQAVVVPDIPRPWGPLRSRAYWHNAPFFLLESGSSALRALVAISGTMSIVGSASAYIWLETGSSLFGALVMFWMAHRVLPRPSLRRLRYGLLGVAGGWLAFSGALVWPPLYAVFIVAMCFAGPVVGATYESLVMTSMELPNHSLQSNAVARELLLVVARSVATALVACLTAFSASPREVLFIALGVTFLTLPAEYFMATRIARSRATQSETKPSA